MPIYDYSCTACRHLVEVIHGIHEVGPRFCPNCGAEGTMRKGFTTPAVHFKGSGWAKKDRSSTASRTKASSAQPASGGDPASGSDAAPSSDAAESAAPKPEPKAVPSTADEGF